MIHKSSSDPVLIKKISLKIWSLRDEIESRLQEKMTDETALTEEEIINIRNLYTKNGSPSPAPNNVTELKPNTDLDTGEDEMARAMAGLDAEEETKEEVKEENNEEAAPAADNIIAISTAKPIDPNIITISLDAPNIPEDKLSKGKTVLSEISMEKMFFFCNKAFTEGQSIVIQFCIPKSFIINADILYCRPFNLKSRIISKNNYTHRALIRFNFLKEGERALLRQFLQSIEPDLTKMDKKSDAGKEDGGDSDFNELDDLGL